MGSITRGKISRASEKFSYDEVVKGTTGCLLPLHVRVIHHFVALVTLSPTKMVKVAKKVYHPFLSREAVGREFLVVSGLDEEPLLCRKAFKEVLPANQVLGCTRLADCKGSHWGEIVEGFLVPELLEPEDDGCLDIWMGSVVCEVSHKCLKVFVPGDVGILSLAELYMEGILRLATSGAATVGLFAPVVVGEANTAILGGVLGYVAAAGHL